MQLANTVAWITGGGKRLGRALALELARRGCHLAIHYGNSAAEAEEVATHARNLGRRAITLQADLASVPQIEAMGTRIEAEFGRLDILINTAANFDRVPLDQITEANWDHAIDVNLKGTTFCALTAARLMRLKKNTGETLAPSIFTDPATQNLLNHATESTNLVPISDSSLITHHSSLSHPPQPATRNPQPDSSRLPAPTLWGKIINFADWSAQRPYRNYLPYMVSKGGVVTLTQTLAQELAPQITVNAIAPGTVLPPIHATPAELQTITANVPLQRIGSPQDIIATALYILEATDYVSGQILTIDGARSIAQPRRF